MKVQARHTNENTIVPVAAIATNMVGRDALLGVRQQSTG